MTRSQAEIEREATNERLGGEIDPEWASWRDRDLDADRAGIDPEIREEQR